MRNSRGDTLAKTERVSTHEISTFCVWIIQSVEEEWSRWRQQVLNVLLQCIDLFTSWVLGNLQWKFQNTIQP